MKSEHDKKLVDNVQPSNWINPEPADMYNLVVIGGGPAGLVTAAGAAGVGARVALVERHYMGGDCLNYGCVPSKAVIRAGRAAASVREAHQFGIDVPEDVPIDFAAAMERMRELRARLSAHDSTLRFQKELGVDVFQGEARFKKNGVIYVDGTELKYKKAVIATGARAVIPPVEGLAEAGFLTNETVFDLTERPQHLAVLGAGPIGCELAQAFRRLGSEVTILDRGPQFLHREDRDAAEILHATFKEEGVEVLLNADVQRIELAQGKKIIHLKVDGESLTLPADEILVGVGRRRNVEGLNLGVVGVKYDRYGIKVSDRLQTTNQNIFAVGDVAMRRKFTHAADAAARIVIQNALFAGGKKLSAQTIPWSTYTEPEIAHVGMYDRDAEAAGVELETFVKEFRDVDRAVTDGDEVGFVKVHVKKGTDRIMGATIVGKNAGEMISELTLAITAGVGLGTLASVIHPYPTRAEAIRQVGDLYNRTRLTPRIKRWFQRFLAWRRR